MLGMPYLLLGVFSVVVYRGLKANQRKMEADQAGSAPDSPSL
jgi:hypothetical protein